MPAQSYYCKTNYCEASLTRPYRSDADVERVVHEFLDGNLPPEVWTHAAHLAVGLHFVRQLPFEASVLAMRDGILAFQSRRGATAGAGYNATITRFYMHLIAAWAAEHPEPLSAADDVAALAQSVGSKHAPAQYYSPGRLSSREAVEGWVAPDLRPLPPIQGRLTAGMA